MSLGHGANNQLQGTPKIKPRDPWRSIPQTAGEGLTSDGNTTSLAPIDDGQVLANISGSSDIPVGTSLSNLLDKDISSAQGTIIFRNAVEWVGLPPGTSGYFLETQGTAADVKWTAIVIPPPVTTTKGPPLALGDGNLDLALTDGNFPNPQILLNGDGNPIYISVPLSESSDSNSVTMVAAANLNGNFFVKSNISGKAAVPDLTVLADGIAVVGITTGAISSGASGLIQTGGVMIDPSWSWTPGGAIYVGASGLPTQTVPSSKWVLQGGVAVNATTIEITLGCVISTPL